MDLLNKVDVDGVKLEKKMLNAKFDLREDEVREGLKINEVTLNAEKSMGGAIVVPTVVEE